MLNSIGHFRLYSKTEQLEQLMGEEVTDINEILAVINNIQVQLNKREPDQSYFQTPSLSGQSNTTQSKGGWPSTAGKPGEANLNM